MITIGILIVTALIGYTLRNSCIPKVSSRLMTVVVWLLLFFFGVTVGSNPSIINNIDRFGWQAFILAALGVLGSCVAAKFLMLFKEKN